MLGAEVIWDMIFGLRICKFGEIDYLEKNIHNKIQKL